MRYPLYLLFACLVVLTGISCGNPANAPGAQTEAAGAADQAAADKTAAGPATAATRQFTEGADYFLFERKRVLDKQGFTQPVEAYSLLLPKGWNYEGDILWTATGGGCDGTNHWFKASSPDGKFRFEILPLVVWGWSSNPAMQEFYRNAPTSRYCGFGEPMNADQYVRTVMAPQDMDNAEIVSLSPNPSVVQEMQESNDKGRMELMRYGASDVQFHQTAVQAKLRWPAGNQEGIALCGVSVVETTLPNVYDGTYDKQFTSQAVNRVVFRYPSGEGETASQLLSTIMSGLRTNPAWKDAVNNFWSDVRQKKQVAHIGKIRMMDEQTRAIGEAAIKSGEARLRNMDIQMRQWEERQQSQDRQHSQFIKAIREVETYRDETGRIELNAGYGHAWSRSDGSSFILSNNPNFDPAAVFLDQNWKEMKKVD